MYSLEEIEKVDSEIADLIKAEVQRQNSHIELIASENWVSKAVMAAMGSPLTNKYAEGYPGKRFYGGCVCVDEVEQLAIDRAKELFGCEYANVQPHSGAQANMAVFFAMLKPGDTVMGMNLAHGGHLTHGSPANLSGAYFNVVSYGVNDDGVIDYEEVRRIALENHPKLIRDNQKLSLCSTRSATDTGILAPFARSSADSGRIASTEPYVCIILLALSGPIPSIDSRREKDASRLLIRWLNDVANLWHSSRTAISTRSPGSL